MDAKNLKNPMTPGGYKIIAEEHDHLLSVIRPRVVEAIATAAAEGDRSENAEYIYGKKRLREIDKKLRQLTGFLKDVQIIDAQNIRSDRVEFGATVSLLDENENSSTWTIVGVGEADVEKNTISWRSPLARAIMGKKVGDFAEVLLPKGEKQVEIIEILYAGKKMS